MPELRTPTIDRLNLADTATVLDLNSLFKRTDRHHLVLTPRTHAQENPNGTPDTGDADDDVVGFVARTATGVVGYVEVGPPAGEPWHAYLGNNSTPLELRCLIVDPHARGNGCGRKLVELASRTIADRGQSGVLATIATTSPQARHLYLDIGWEDDGDFDGKDGSNHVMRLNRT